MYGSLEEDKCMLKARVFSAHDEAMHEELGSGMIEALHGVW